jgi:hypothetical protein
MFIWADISFKCQIGNTKLNDKLSVNVNQSQFIGIRLRINWKTNEMFIWADINSKH